MSTLISTSWKNVWRNKLRSSIVIIAVMIGLFGGIFASAVMSGMSEQRVNAAIKNEVSHIQLHQTHFLDNNEMHLTIPGSSTKIDSIEALPRVEAASGRLKITSMAQTAETGSGVMVIGVHPEKEKAVTDLHKEIPDSLGHYFEKDMHNPIVIGQALAEKLHVNLRSKIILTFQEMGGTLTGGAFRVAGIFDLKNSTFEEMNVFVHFNDIKRLAQIPNNETHEIAVRLTDAEATQPVLSKLQTQFPGLSILPWGKLQPDLGLVTDFLDIMLYLVMVIILLALAFGIVNTMLMVVLERVKELGMLMAIGMNRKRVFAMIMYETIFLSIVGGVLGMLLSAGTIAYFGEAGINLQAFAEGLEAVGYSAMLYPAIDTAFYFGVGALIVLTAIVSSVYPAIKALQLNPADALRMEN